MTSPIENNPSATILHGDCLEVMRGMENDSVDLVFCSPPYEAARTYGVGEYYLDANHEKQFRWIKPGKDESGDAIPRYKDQ